MSGVAAKMFQQYFVFARNMRTVLSYINRQAMLKIHRKRLAGDGKCNFTFCGNHNDREFNKINIKKTCLLEWCRKMTS